MTIYFKIYRLGHLKIFNPILKANTVDNVEDILFADIFF